jgi:hypothetical protein
VPLLRRTVELSLERPVGAAGPSGGVARLTARFEVAPGEEGPGPSELRRALDELATELDALVGAPLAAAPIAQTDRGVEELVQAYRPRQRELVDLLRDEGEISPAEHGRLVQYLLGREESRSPVPAALPLPIDRPLAAAPVAADRSLPPARPVPELLREYSIASLKQAGAVRARRQISFAEYMALKRHFEGSGAGGEPGGPPSSG